MQMDEARFAKRKFSFGKDFCSEGRQRLAEPHASRAHNLLRRTGLSLTLTLSPREREQEAGVFVFASQVRASDPSRKVE